MFRILRRSRWQSRRGCFALEVAGPWTTVKRVGDLEVGSSSGQSPTSISPGRPKPHATSTVHRLDAPLSLPPRPTLSPPPGHRRERGAANARRGAGAGSSGKDKGPREDAPLGLPCTCELLPGSQRARRRPAQATNRCSAVELGRYSRLVDIWRRRPEASRQCEVR